MDTDQKARQISVSAESIFSRPVSESQKSVLSRIAERQAAEDESGIDYSEIPALMDEELAQFRRSARAMVDGRVDREHDNV